MKLIRLTLATSLIAVLAACGGGGDGAASTPANVLAADTLRVTVNGTDTDFAVPLTTQTIAGQLGMDSSDKKMNLSVTYSTSGGTATVTGIAVTVGTDIYQCNASPSVRSPACTASAISMDATAKTIAIKDLTLQPYAPKTAPALNVDTTKPSAVINVTQIRWS
jgi:hypothetical protein